MPFHNNIISRQIQRASNVTTYTESEAQANQHNSDIHHILESNTEHEPTTQSASMLLSDAEGSYLALHVHHIKRTQN